jgi:hypothetical protein
MTNADGSITLMVDSATGGGLELSVKLLGVTTLSISDFTGFNGG